jgi:exodeoxyribonuclease VII large subunit
MLDVELSVSEFIGSLNQTLEYAYPNISITGELANFRVSKGQWVYFDLKDEFASLKCFGTVYQLPGPLEEGMLIKVKGAPKMHSMYGFSFNIQSIQPVGEGNLKKAADLLAQKLQKEGLFDPARKRPLPFPPRSLGLITSSESAAYADFVKILAERWNGVDIDLIDVVVQGDLAPGAITTALKQFNEQASPPDVLVVIRGGGSPEDLWAFNTEQVTRAVAASRIPTIVAIGHEVDISLAELAADQRASTPSNAAQLLVPDRRQEILAVKNHEKQLHQAMKKFTEQIRQGIKADQGNLVKRIDQVLSYAKEQLKSRVQLLEVLSPNSALNRGYAIVRQSSKLVRSGKNIVTGSILDISLIDSEIKSQVTSVELKSKE